MPRTASSIGIGPTTAVQFPNGAMQAFEPSELERVAKGADAKTELRPASLRAGINRLGGSLSGVGLKIRLQKK